MLFFVPTVNRSFKLTSHSRITIIYWDCRLQVFPPFLYRGNSFRTDSTKHINIFLADSCLSSTKHWYSSFSSLFPAPLGGWMQDFTSASCSSSDCRKQKASPTPSHNTDRRKHWMQPWQTGLCESGASFKELLCVWRDPCHLIQAWSLPVLSAGGKE